MRRFLSLLIPLAALVIVSLAAPAHAGGPIDRSTYSGTNEPFTECGGAYLGLSTFSGRTTINASTPPLEGQFFRFTNQYNFSDRLTNPLNGKYVVLSGSGILKEIQPRSQGGGLFTYVTHDAGQFTISDSSGRVLIKETGMVAFSYLFDTLSDGTPGGDLLSEELLRVSGPHPTFSDSFDFCGFLDGVIG